MNPSKRLSFLRRERKKIDDTIDRLLRSVNALNGEVSLLESMQSILSSFSSEFLNVSTKCDWKAQTIYKLKLRMQRRYKNEILLEVDAIELCYKSMRKQVSFIPFATGSWTDSSSLQQCDEIVHDTGLIVCALSNKIKSFKLSHGKKLIL